jgi:hypothetical protein
MAGEEEGRHLVFKVDIGTGLRQDLDDARETVPGCDVEPRLLVLGGTK